MYWLPSASVSVQPWALAMKGGEPPTARKARTGLFTPPTISRSARSNRLCDFWWDRSFCFSMLGSGSARAATLILISALVVVDRTPPLFDQVQRLGARPAQPREAGQELR